MPLQVWLPLTGDLSNQGLNDLEPIQTTAPTYVDGKLGKAMSTGALYLPAKDVAKFYNNNAMSFAFWIYPVGTSGSGPIIGRQAMAAGDNRMFTIFQYPGPNDLHLSWQSNESDTTFIASILYGAFPADTWTHCAIAYDGAKAAIYINGEYQTAWSGVSTRTNFEYDVPIPSKSIRYLNDFRIYDHCLSPKEVKILSQGLVVHYQLNDRPCDNLYTGTRNFTGTWVSSGNWTTDTSQTFNGFTVKQRTGTWGGLAQNVTATKGDIFTISFYAKVETGGTVESVHRSNLGNVTTGLSILDGNFVSGDRWIGTDASITSWKYCWATIKIVGDDITYLQWRIENSQANKTMWIARFKLERGNKATAWMPNPADAEYTIMGYNEPIVYDSSGYNYHGTSSGVSVSSDTSRYGVSTVFDANTDTITPTACFSVGQTMTELSVSCWFRTNTLNSTSPNMWSFGENSFARIRLASSTSIGYYVRVGSSQVYGTYSAGKTLTDNTWHHVVYVFKNGVVRIYLDNVQIGTTDHSSTATYMTCSSTAWHLAGYGANSENFIGSLSDVRIYATTLSADDVKELYQVGASIDKSGNMYAYEFNEV